MSQKFRKWRLIVRNLGFDVTESDLQHSFSDYGDLREIVMPKKKGRFAGFCFVQFEKSNEAESAMKNLNGKSIKGRTVAIDWAIPKDLYMTSVIEEKQRSKRFAEDSKPSTDTDNVGNLKHECTSSSDSSDNESQENSDDDDDDVTKKSDKFLKKSQEKSGAVKKPKLSDVGEGKTVFIRGLPFALENDELEEAFEKFGSLKYGVICRYHDSNMSKGSGFVQFLEKEGVEKCLAAANGVPGITLKGRQLTVCMAVGKNDLVKIDSKKNEQDSENKAMDKRNLHLLRVGLIRQGTQDEAGMSKLDAKKRLKIESANRLKIKNLNIFVSPTRLVVHNLPTGLKDQQLRHVCLEALGAENATTAKIKECRIMRDMDSEDPKNKARSRGYAFVEFEKHEHALMCLKQLNNNPAVFSDEKRPIVEFSLENRLALNAKALRLEKSRENLKKNTDNVERKQNFPEPAPKRQKKMVFKPQLVPAPKNAPKNPFPSHMGPKIRTRRAPKAGKAKTKKKSTQDS